jgi:serine/threonine protein kinase
MGALDSHLSGYPPQAQLPEQFGKYSLLGHLATGGMAEVWLARQLGIQGFEKLVVIKRARPELSDEDTTSHFLDEARLVATLEHPNIAQVYEMGLVNGAYFFAMEYVDGADLRRLIDAALTKRQRISLADALYIIIHVCAALHYAHEKRNLDGESLHIIHRDVSPSNVLISYDGAIKVCDFGIAKAHSRRAENTQRGVLKGKFSYMSPEQCQSRPLDRRSDVFSIGILLYELTTLTKLFRADNDFELLQKIVQQPIPPPSTRCAELPRELEDIVMKALAKAPADRYATAQELQLELESFAREHKLAMSSVNIARLIGGLFEKRNDDWIRAQRMQGEQYDSIEISQGDGAEAPEFFAVGSAPTPARGPRQHSQMTALLPPPRVGLASRATPLSLPAQDPTAATRVGNKTGRSRTGEAPAAPATPATPANGAEPVTSAAGAAPAPRRALGLALAAVLAGGVALGADLLEKTLRADAARSTSSALQAAAARAAELLSVTAHAARLRLDGVATAPMLRAAIGTDTATVADLINNEMLFTANAGEALEVFQLRGEAATSLLRIPTSAAPLSWHKGREAGAVSVGGALAVQVGAPVAGYDGAVVGGLVLSTPVELSALRDALAGHVTAASLRGLGQEIRLIGEGGGGGPRGAEIAVPMKGEWRGERIALAVERRAAGALPWGSPVRYAFGGAAVLLLIGFFARALRRVGS